jgi:hypothetical protein
MTTKHIIAAIIYLIIFIAFIVMIFKSYGKDAWWFLLVFFGVLGGFGVLMVYLLD